MILFLSEHHQKKIILVWLEDTAHDQRKEVYEHADRILMRRCMNKLGLGAPEITFKKGGEHFPILARKTQPTTNNIKIHIHVSKAKLTLLMHSSFAKTAN